MSQCRRLIVLLWLVLGTAGVARAIDPDRRLTQTLHRIWQVQQGLPDPTLYCVRQFGDSYLWLGTQTGLVRFDGVQFTRIEHAGPISLANIWIRDIADDGHGGLWLATIGSGVIHRHDGGGRAGEHYGVADGLPSESVRQVCVDPAGQVWACTNQGIARLAQGKFIACPTGLHSNNVVAMCSRREGRGEGGLWMVTEDGELAAWDGRSFEPQPSPTLAANGRVFDMVKSSDGALWIGTSGGLLRWADGHAELLTTAQGLADNAVLCVADGSDGTLWAGTRNGFSRVRGVPGREEIDSFQAEDGLSQSTVYSMCEDREGSLWVGTKHGLNQFLDGRVVPFTVSEGLPSNRTGPVLGDVDGTTWIGTLGGGLSRFNGKGFSVLTTRNGLASDTIVALAAGGRKDPDGLWIGTDKGVSHLAAGRIEQTYTVRDGLPANGVGCLFRDRAGVLWAGTDAGLARFQEGKFVAVPGVAAAITALGETRDGELLAATQGGDLYGVKEGAVRNLSAANARLRNADAFYTDAQGMLWVGTSVGGLRLVDPHGKVTAFTVRDGLFDNEIFGIVADGSGPGPGGRLWMACSKGIFSVSRADLLAFAAGHLQRLVSAPFSPTEAQRTIECRSGVQPAAWRMADGRLWFSTTHGVIVVDPAHLHRATGPAPAVMQDVIVNGRSEFPGEIGTLPAGIKNLEFRYTALSLVVPSRINFRYQLAGFDKEWVDAGTRREAFYTNLPAGKYRFLVEARNVEGSWSEAAAPVAFSLAPYLYQRRWFFPLCALLAAAAAWSLYRLRVRAIKGRLHAIVGERSRIARELHDTLLQGFSGVTMEMQALAARLPAESEQRNTLQEIIGDAGNCMKEARRSVAGLRQSVAAGGGSGLAQAIGQMARQLTETREVRLKLELAEQTPALPADVEYNLVRIAQEAIANAVKHSGARVIEVTLACAGGEAGGEGGGGGERVEMMVRDDGSGFAEEAVKAGAGHYGLTGMRERAGQIGAGYRVETGGGRGTTVSVVLPAPNRAVPLPKSP